MQKHKYSVLEWPSQSPDLNIIENVWIDLKQAVYAWKPRNLTELWAFCMKEWAKITPARLQGLVCGNRRRLQAVIAAKGALLNINGIISLGCPNLCTFLFLFKCT